jgi:hypothetical protein
VAPQRLVGEVSCRLERRANHSWSSRAPRARNAWLPAHGLSTAGDVWAALLRIIFGERFVDELALAAGELYSQLGGLTNRVLDGVACVHGSGLRSPHQHQDLSTGSSTYWMLLVWEPSPWMVSGSLESAWVTKLGIMGPSSSKRPNADPAEKNPLTPPFYDVLRPQGPPRRCLKTRRTKRGLPRRYRRQSRRGSRRRRASHSKPFLVRRRGPRLSLPET